MDGGLMDDTISTLDREIELVKGAVRMVATGSASRLTVAGLWFGAAVVDVLDAWARLAGVALEPLWGLGDSPCDIRVTRVVR